MVSYSLRPSYSPTTRSLTRLTSRRSVVPLLKKLEKSKSKEAHLLEGKLSDGSDPLDLLDPLLHSVGYLFFL